MRHCESCKTGRSDGQEVHAPLSSGVEQVPHEGEQGRQVPFMARVLNGQVDIHWPEEAKVLSGQRVHVVADVMQDKQESSHPAHQLLFPQNSLRWHVPFFPAVPGGRKKPSEQVFTHFPDSSRYPSWHAEQVNDP